jgi:hypothetical protein
LGVPIQEETTIQMTFTVDGQTQVAEAISSGDDSPIQLKRATTVETRRVNNDTFLRVPSIANDPGMDLSSLQ